MNLRHGVIVGILAASAFVMQGKGPLAAAGTTAYIKILSPCQEQCLPGPDVPVRFETSGMQFCPSGCNMHFVLDDQPFEVQFDPSHPHIFRDVKPGTHTVRVYAANHRHEAIPGTLAMVTFSVVYATEENRPEPMLPLLTLNLPQGEYKGLDAADIAVDFLVTGTPLSKRGNRVQIFVDGRRYISYDCAPRHFQGLAPGFHVVRMELVDRQGQVIPGPFNSVSRTILLSPEKQLARARPGSPPPRQPVIDSIHGAMTNGMPWVMTEKQRPGSKRKTRKSVFVDDSEIDVISVAPEDEPAEQETGELDEIPGVHVGTESPSDQSLDEKEPAVSEATEKVTVTPSTAAKSVTRTTTQSRTLKAPGRGTSSVPPSVVTLQAVKVTSASTVMRAKPTVVTPLLVVTPPPASPTPQLQMATPTPSVTEKATSAPVQSSLGAGAVRALSPEEINPMLPKPASEGEQEEGK